MQYFEYFSLYCMIEEVKALYSCEVKLMANQLSISYYYISVENLTRLERYRECCGDPEKTVVNSFIRSWVGRNRDYYIRLGKADADRRNLTFRDWGELIFNSSKIPYHPTILRFEHDPLSRISTGDCEERRGLNYITLGKQNLVLIRIAAYHADCSMIQYVSKIVKNHMIKNWDRLYQPQIDAEDWNNWV